ncbi:TIGR03084 family metal-binding protein [Micromonospora sp. NPDC005686]|uniref:TIGR03084 family metal-binding protein n=1 Tax=unclassified Micromonospora TaxID=2617518 RepID=UPI0033B195F6
MTAPPDIYVQLTAQGEEVDRLVADLDAASWDRPTPAPGWTVAHQIAHLTATFRMAETAVSAPDDFRAFTASLGGDFDANVQRALGAYLTEPRDVLLKKWRAARVAVDEALAGTPPMQIVPWLVRPLPAAVLAAAGMMELFAHGQDIADALGVRRTYDDGLRHLVDFISRTWDFGYQSRALETPDVRLRFEVTAPSGALWTYGADDATDVISGPAVDLCLLATRRRHRDDLALTGTGAEADRWLDIAQAYRGPAGEGRRPGQFDH